MRVALIGNVCNNMYNIGKALETYTDIEPVLYLGDALDVFTDPLNNDKEASNQNWVHKNKKWDPSFLFKKGDFSFINELKKKNFDFIIVSDIGVWLAPFLPNTIKIMWTTGADITRMPFPFQFKFLHKNIFAFSKACYMAFLQRWGLKHIDYFMTQPFSPFQVALNKLKVPESKRLNVYFPLILDLNIFQYSSNFTSVLDGSIINKISAFKFKIFHPSRLMLQKNRALVNSGQWKRNEALLEGLRVFIDTTGILDICIVLPNKATTYDKTIFLEKANKLGVENNLVWVDSPNKQGFNKQEMVALYSISDLVVDEFGIGWFGSIVVEAAACSRPIMCNIDEEAMQTMYPWHPIINVKTPETIAAELEKLYFDKEYADQKSKSGRAWAEEFHSLDNAGKRYASQIKNLVEIV